MRARELWNYVVEWLKRYRLSALYFLFAVVIEMTAVFTVEGNPLIARPFIALGLLLFFTGGVLLIKSEKARLIVYAALLIFQSAADLVFAVIFDMTGQYFDFGMFNLRNDAFGTLESIPVNFTTFYVGLFCCIVFIVYGMRTRKRRRAGFVYNAKRVAYYAALTVSGIAVTGVSLFAYNPVKSDKYEQMLKGSASGAYSSYGMIGNFVNEFAGATFLKQKSRITNAEAADFLYEKIATPTQYFGVAEDKNVVVVLVESLEWFSFLQDEAYPNQIGFTQEQLEYLFPNLTKFYGESVVASNFYSREKTDIAETLSILGSYPTDAYVNYEYAENTAPHTLPNILQSFYGEENVQCRSFHNGWKTFYNRHKAHAMFGFESLTDMYDMEKLALENYRAGLTDELTMRDYYKDGERNLDYEMIDTCKDMMFPTDKRFFTYITTITMHGVYYERENLKTEREKLMEVYSLPKNASDGETALFHYLYAVMHFDKALGRMMEDLEQKGLLDKTTVVLFGDHNTYYQGLSNYVKDIDGYDASRVYTELYNVPLMIRDSALGHKLVDKFTCTADIVPTLLDLLGIKYYENLYYGNSILAPEASVLYSRAYGTFIREGLVGSSLSNILYRHDNVTDEQLHDFQAEGTRLVEKIKYCDYIFEKDYFANEDNLAQYKDKMLTVNGR